MVKIDQTLRCRKRGNNADAGVPKSRDDQQESTVIRVPDAAAALLSIDGFGLDVERIIVNNLFSLVRQHLMAGKVIAIGIVPLESEFGVQNLL